jgi:hypothetical protein
VRRFSISIISKTDPRGGLEFAVVDAPQWTRRLIGLGYLLLRLTNDKVGVRLVSHGYRLHDERARQFLIPATGQQVDEFRRWRRRGGR